MPRETVRRFAHREVVPSLAEWEARGEFGGGTTEIMNEVIAARLGL